MAWTDVDLRKCWLFDLVGDVATVSADGTSVTMLNLDKNSDYVTLMRKMPSSPLSDFSFRFEIDVPGGTLPTYYLESVPGMESRPGSYTDYVSAGYPADEYAIFCLMRTSATRVPYLVLKGIEPGAELTCGQYTLSTGGHYYVTVEFDADGASGASRVTMTVRTGSHTGSVVGSPQTMDFNTDVSGKFKYYCPHASGGALGSGSRSMTIVTANHQTDFDDDVYDFGSEIPSGPSDVALAYEPQDLTTYDEVDSEDDFGTVLPNLIPNVDQVSKDSAVAIFTKAQAVSGDFTIFCLAKVTQGSSFSYYNANIAAVAGEIGAIADIVASGGYNLGIGISTNATGALYARVRETDAGSESGTTGAVLLAYTRRYFFRLKRVVADGAFGTVYGAVLIGHPENINPVDSVSVALKSNQNYQYVYPFQSHHAVGSGGRYMKFDMTDFGGDVFVLPPTPGGNPPEVSRGLSRLGVVISLGTRKKYRLR